MSHTIVRRKGCCVLQQEGFASLKRSRKQRCPFTRELETEELREVERLWLRSVRDESFGEQMSFLKEGRSNKLVTPL